MRRDAYQGALWSVAEAMANLVAVGGDPEQVVLVNNYIWPFPDEYSLGVLDRAVDGVVEAMQRYGAPVISGKDSLSSTYTFADGTRLEIPPVLCISAVGRMHDVRKSVSSDFKHAGSVIILVGQIARDAIGGSVYEELFGRDEVCGDVPNVDAQRMLWSLWKSVHSHIVQGDILSCHDISEGGVAVTLAEMCFGGRIGASFDVGLIGEGRLSELFFTEMAGCFLVEVSVSTFCQKKLFVGVPHVALGQTHLRQTITLFDHGKYITTLSLEVLRQAWQKPMQEVFGS
jgi:phosphoribosylformylglycinamidine synthase